MLVQFLIESVMLALVGGALGVLVGVGIAELVTALIGMPSAIKIWAVAAGLVVAASVGVFFGVWPARKAAKLDPMSSWNLLKGDPGCDSIFDIAFDIGDIPRNNLRLH